MLSFKERFTLLVEDITSEMEINLITQNQEFSYLSQKSIDLFMEIKKHLPVNHQHLVTDYECTELLLRHYVMNAAFRKGLKSGIGLIQSLN